MNRTGQQREIIVLGSGTSVGVPVIGCECKTCTSDHPRNNRMRCSIAIPIGEQWVIVDTPPEIRLQLVREKIPLVHATLFTHAHADHIFGLDDLRICGHRLDAPVPLYCEEPVEKALRKSYYYAFGNEAPINPHKFALPRLRFERIGLEPFELFGQEIRPLRLMHGKLPVLGFRVGDVAYCTDVSMIPEETWPHLEGLDTLILDALRHEPHTTHFNVEQALEVVERVKPKQTYFTHLACMLEYEETNAELPDGVELAYDGLRVPF